MAPTLKPDLPQVVVETRADWRAWLAANHDQETGVWAVTVKKSALADGEEYVGPGELGEECLCFGWIDSKSARIDDRLTALLCTPRRKGSGWSKVNKERLERLLAADLMAPAGLAVIEAAKEDGSWTKLDAVEALIVPDDLAASLAELPPAREKWDAFPPSTRRAILEWITLAKREATRAKRVDETARLAQKNERANQWPRK